MFGLGFTEILILAIFALLVFGPEKIPELMSGVGKALRYFRRTANDLRRTLDEETKDLLPKDVQLPKMKDLLWDDLPRRADASPTRRRAARNAAKAAAAAAVGKPLEDAGDPGTDDDGADPYADAQVYGTQGPEPDPEASVPPPEPIMRSHERRARADAIASALDRADSEET